MKYRNLILAAAASVFCIQNALSQSTIAGNTLSGTLPSSPNEYLGSLNGADVVFKSTGTERMRILSTGSVGIGTSSPARTFHVQTASTNGGMRVTQTASGFSSMELYNSTTGGHNWAMVSTGNGNSEGAGNLGLYDYTSGGYKFWINGSNGNTGVGIITPSAKLHIAGDVLASTIQTPTSAPLVHTATSWSTVSAPDYTWYANTTTGIFHPSANVIGFTINGAEAMRVHSNSFVGIGTTAPLTKLHVDNGIIRVTGTNSSGGPMVVWGGNAVTAPNGEWGLEYDASVAGKEGLNFWRPFGCTGPTGNDFLFCANTGRIGVNTNNPTAQLTVNGNVLIGDPAVVCIPNANYKLFVQTGILTEKVKVAVNCATDWSDYVFEKNYKLNDLNSLEQFVQTNKHLPNIPSADEVVKNGVDLGDITSRLLGKVEELTLYIIDQNKKIDDQNKKMEILQQEVTNLKKN